jgi:mannose-6-phosphate isomerase-like protein (cupin superfamily)
MKLNRAPLFVIFSVTAALAAEGIDPTFIRRSLAAAEDAPSDMTTPACRYQPLFGAGDRQAKPLKSVARYGQVTVAGGGACRPVKNAGEEQIYFVLEGAGTLLCAGSKFPLKKDDFVYLPPGIEHTLAGGSGALRAIWMGFRVPAGIAPAPAGKPAIANLADVPKQVVGNHPPSTLYQLMIGDRSSKRDKIAASLSVSSLFVMEFTAGGTNAPHHHEREEEVYLLLDGTGEMVAGGGMDGIEGRFPAKAGDAYFYRLNTTVGFYNAPGGAKAHILAVRSAMAPPKAKE